MRIKCLRVRNFRGIRDLELELGKVTVLIGENNSGKTSVLDAMKICLRDLGPRRRVVFRWARLPSGGLDNRNRRPQTLSRSR